MCYSVGLLFVVFTQENKMDSRTTGYNLFCKELSSEEGIVQELQCRPLKVDVTEYIILYVPTEPLILDVKLFLEFIFNQV